MPKTCVLVTGVGGRSFGHQILHALLRPGDKYRIVAVDADTFSFGLYQVEQRYIVPPATHPLYLSAIVRLIKKEGVQVLIPGTEIELFTLVQHRQEIEDAGCLLLANPEIVVRICRNKWQLCQWLTGHRIETPITVRVDDREKLLAATGFPIVAKPTENTGGSRHVALLKDREELKKYLADMKNIEVILQEYVGSEEEEYTVGILIDKAGEVIDSIVIQRKLVGLSLGDRRIINNKSYFLSTGYSQGFVIRHPQIQRQCEELAVMIGARGPLNIQCRFVTGKINVFEVHPRFSGTTSIRADVSFNEPDILIRNFLHDEKFGRLDYLSDVAVIRAFQHSVIPIKEMTEIPVLKTGGED
jgi:carbamoyl-phosphate synthase large subunit